MKERSGTVYKGKQTLIDHDTGEKYEVDKIYRKQTQGNFVKAYIRGLVMMLDVTGGAKLKVVNYLLENLSLSDNKLVATVREIGESLKISTKTVTETLKTLENGNVIKRKTGVIMLNPEILYRGDDSKQRFLLVEFAQFSREDEIKHAKDEFESFSESFAEVEKILKPDELTATAEPSDDAEEYEDLEENPEMRDIQGFENNL